MSNHEQLPIIGVRSQEITDGLLRDIATMYFAAAYNQETPAETEIYDVCDDEYWGGRVYGSLLSEESELLVLREPHIKVVHFDLAVNVPGAYAEDVEHVYMSIIPVQMRNQFVQDVSQYLTEIGIGYQILDCVHEVSGPAQPA